MIWTTDAVGGNYKVLFEDCRRVQDCGPTRTKTSESVWGLASSLKAVLYGDS